MNRILRLIFAFMIIALFVSGALGQTVTTGSITVSRDWLVARAWLRGEIAGWQ